MPFALQALASARDWFDWSGLGLSVGGTFLSLLGLYATFREARAAKHRAHDARSAAQAAHAAAVEAVRAVSARVTAADLTNIRRDLESVLAALAEGEALVALALVRTIRAALNGLRERLDSIVNRREVGRVLEDVGELQRVLEKAVHEDGLLPPFTEVSERLSRHMDTLTRWSEQTRFQKVESL